MGTTREQSIGESEYQVAGHQKSREALRRATLAQGRQERAVTAKQLDSRFHGNDRELVG
jgi:hypothetical protein